MSAHLARAQLLLQQSRPADAELEAGLAVAQAPDQPQGYAVLALSRLDQDKGTSALEAARTALGLAPDSAHYHYIHALVLHRLKKNGPAFLAIHEAIRLAPEDEDNFSLLASIQLSLGDWSAALAAAEQALALNPEHNGAVNLRSMALVRLGRKAEAVQAVDFALERNPESALSHATQGWNQLHRNDPHRALEHFREALRLDPDFEFAREGMLEALKARHLVYRLMLAYFLWMRRLSARYQWAVLGCTLFGSRFLVQTAHAHPDPKWIWWIVLGSFYGFLYLTWTAYPMFNLFLRLDRFGRHVLTPAQRVASNWFGSFFAAALAATVWFFVSDSELAFFAMYSLAALSICVASTFSRTGRSRLILGSATALLACFALLAASPLRFIVPDPSGFGLLFAYGFIGFQLLANILASK